MEECGLKPNGEPIGTNPNLKDSDGDGIEDQIELGYMNINQIVYTPQGYLEYLTYTSDPAKADSDDDNLDDEFELLLGTNQNVSDTDRDELTDGEEVSLWFDPLDANPDGDTYEDLDEYKNGTDPFTYDHTLWEWRMEFEKGFLLGDFMESDTIPAFLGQITSGLIPYVTLAADGRDVIANLGNGEWGFAALSAFGVVTGIGDVAKVGGELAEFIAKNADNASEIVKVVTKTAEQFPDIAKYLPESALDNIVKSLKNGQALSKSEYLKLKKIFEAGGKNLDEIIAVGKKTVEDILSNKTLTNSTYKMKNYVSATEGFDAAKADFDSLPLISVDPEPRANGTIVGYLTDGSVVNVRPDSSKGYPTLEIFDSNSATSIKIRY